MTDGKKEYLQMLQEPICRMSTISAIFKGFAATIVAGISAISYSSTNVWVLALFVFACTLICCFGCLLFEIGKKTSLLV